MLKELDIEFGFVKTQFQYFTLPFFLPHPEPPNNEEVYCVVSFSTGFYMFTNTDSN